MNWVVGNLQNSLDTWNSKLNEIWTLVSTSPDTFKGGTIWNVIVNIHGALQAIGLGLLVLFFVVGVMKTCGSFAEVKKPEHALKLFIRFAIAKGVVTYGLELMMAVFKIIQGVVSTIMNSAGLGGATQATLPQAMIDAINGCGFFEFYLYTAIAPIPLSTFAGEPTQSVGKNFLKSYCSVCLEGAIIVLACVIFSLFASSPPVVDTGAAPVTMVWKYIGELVFNMLVLVGTIKASDRIVREMMGL